MEFYREFYKAETLENHTRLFHEVKREHKQLVENAFCEQRKKKRRKKGLSSNAASIYRMVDVFESST